MSLPNKEAVCTAGLGLLAVALSNHFQRRAVISRLPRYAVFGVGGFALGHLIHERVQKGVREREIVIFDYIKNHPEDFPEYQPRLYKDVIEPWYPIR